MKNIKTYGTEDGRISSNMVRPDDFSDRQYDGIYIYVNQQKEPVIVSRSKDAEPVRWKVATGSSSMYFTTLREALDYCQSREYTLVTGGEHR